MLKMQKCFTFAEQYMTEHLCGLVMQQILTFTGARVMAPLGTIIVVTLTHHNEVPLLISDNTYIRMWGITWKATCSH
jgi:hypothetical protein